MNTVKYDEDITALLLIDPYNDFISEGGKVWERVRGIAESVSERGNAATIERLKTGHVR